MDFVRLDRADAVVTATKSLAVGLRIEGHYGAGCHTIWP